jgi:hypothetical protein
MSIKRKLIEINREKYYEKDCYAAVFQLPKKKISEVILSKALLLRKNR